MTADWFLEKHTPHVGIAVEIGERLFKDKSAFQEIEVVQTLEFGRMLVVDGAVMFTERDEFVYHEMIVHPPLFAHGKPEQVLIVGGGDGGTIREVLKHESVRSITLVEIDGMVIETCRKFFPDLSAGMDHPKVRVVVGDGFAFLDEHPDTFDVILVDSTDPVPLLPGTKMGPAEKLFSPVFYEKLRKSLRAGGLTVFQSENPFYGGEVLRKMHDELRQSFPIVELYLVHIPTYPGGLWSFTHASASVELRRVPPETIRAPFLDDLKYFHPGMLPAALTLPQFVRNLLDG